MPNRHALPEEFKKVSKQIAGNVKVNFTLYFGGKKTTVAIKSDK